MSGKVQHDDVKMHVPGRQQPWGETVGAWRVLRRAVVMIIVVALAARFASWIQPNFSVTGSNAVFALYFGLVNAVVAPLLVRFAYRLVVYTAGLIIIAVNTAAVYVAGEFDLVEVGTVFAAFIAVIIITGTALVVSTLLSANDDATWFRTVIRRRAKRADSFTATDVPGVLYLEIDGLSEDVLRHALRGGWMPRTHEMIRSGSHTITGWETDLSSQTSASQAGLLQGSNEGIVAFRWYERDRKTVMVSTAPRDAQLLEQRLSTGDGLLADGGVSRNNLLSGDSPDAIATISRVLEPGGAGAAWSVFLTNPASVIRTVGLLIMDIFDELRGNRRQRRARIWPRLDHKGWKYPLVRGATTVVLREITIETLVGDVMRGVPSAYATFVAYDEVAHHDGVDRLPALRQLTELDRAFDRVVRATRFAPRPYHVVILSDHGQSHGATFLQRYGETLEDVVRRGLAGTANVQALLQDVESSSQLSGAMTERMAGDGLIARTGRRMVKADDDGSVVLTASGERESEVGDAADSATDLIVMASGNLGLVYLADRDERVTREELDADHPNLISELATHPGVGFVVVKTAASGTHVIGADGSIRLSDGAVTGENPLAMYGDDALMKLRRHDAFPHMPDLLVMSTYWPDDDEVCAFEELIGSHGGMGGKQSRPFVLHPVELEMPSERLHGAGAVFTVIREWARAAGTTAPSSSPAEEKIDV